jgi:hypothetical protein
MLPGEVQRYWFRFTAADPTTDPVRGGFSGEERGELCGADALDGTCRTAHVGAHER